MFLGILMRCFHVCALQFSEICYIANFSTFQMVKGLNYSIYTFIYISGVSGRIKDWSFYGAYWSIVCHLFATLRIFQKSIPVEVASINNKNAFTEYRLRFLSLSLGLEMLAQHGTKAQHVIKSWERFRFLTRQSDLYFKIIEFTPLRALN